MNELLWEPDEIEGWTCEPEPDVCLRVIASGIGNPSRGVHWAIYSYRNTGEGFITVDDGNVASFEDAKIAAEMAWRTWAAIREC